MNQIYLIPTIISSATLISVTAYLFFIKPRRPYIFPLSLICISSAIWNIGILMTNLSEGNILWGKISTLGIIFVPPVIFHFAISYTRFFKRKYYLISYIPSMILAFLLFRGYYVKDIVYRMIGFEPVYDKTLFYINSWIGLFFTLFSTWLFYISYSNNIGIKRRQSLYLLIAIPANAFLSFLSYEIMVNNFNMAQFPLGSSLDFIIISLIIYAILKFKLAVESVSEVDFRILAETASEGICIIDNKGNVDYANEHFCRILDMPEKKIMGRKFIDFVALPYRETFLSGFRKLMRGKKFMGMELEIYGDGKRIVAEINASPIIWNNEVIGGFLAIRDIEERKKVEEELRKQKTYFQALFENSPEAIVSLDENHHVIDINPAFERLFGYKLDELKGKDIDDFILPESEKKSGKEITKQVINGKVIRAEGERKRKDGSTVYVSILGSPIFIEGKQVGIFAIYRDITARKEAEEEREFYNSLLRHDIANKNTIIQGNLELLSESNLDEEQRAMVEDALKAVSSSNELIATIRNLHKISGKREFYEVEINKVISKVIKYLRQQAQNKGIKIKYVPVKGYLMADSLLENVFSNLIQNAIIHSQCKTIKIYGGEVKRGGKTFYRISVEDDGTGISSEVRKNIFMPGVKRKDSPGSGLGLYLVKTIVESYGGHMELREPKDGKGTIFDIYLPKPEKK